MKKQKEVMVPMAPNFAMAMLALIGSLEMLLPQLAPKDADLSEHLGGLKILRDTIQSAIAASVGSEG